MSGLVLFGSVWIGGGGGGERVSDLLWLWVLCVLVVVCLNCDNWMQVKKGEDDNISVISPDPRFIDTIYMALIDALESTLGAF